MTKKENQMSVCEQLNALISHEAERLKNEESTKHEDWAEIAASIHVLLNSPKNRLLIVKFLGPKIVKWDEEPHLRYHLLAGNEAPNITSDSEDFLKLPLDSPGIPYEDQYPTTSCLFSSVHLGQRKLLIHEIFFLIKYGDRAKIVVYIGAAGGRHIPVLCELFPDHRFLLYDPAQFSRGMVDYAKTHPKRVKIYNELFPPHDKGSQSYRDLHEVIDEGFLLISDIRRCDKEAVSPSNDDVIADMKLQVDICREMQPRIAHLKCRLPFLGPSQPDITVEIPKGDIYFQAWVGSKSTETRLIAEAPYDQMVSLSSRWYESALFRHNTNGRYFRYFLPSLTSLDFFLGRVYDRCFDCTFERYTIWLYLKSNSNRSFISIYELIKRTLGNEEKRLLKSN